MAHTRFFWTLLSGLGAPSHPPLRREATLKRRLLVALLIMTVVVFVACEAIILMGGRLAIDGAMDRELWARSDALIRLFEVEPDGSVELEAPFGSTRAVAGVPPFRLVRLSDGRELAHSEELGDAPWIAPPWPSGRTAQETYWTASLSGRPHRFLSRRFSARRAEEAPPGSAPVVCRVDVGIDREPYDAQFRAMVRWTIPIGAGGLVLLLALGWLLVGRGLRPLEQLADAVGTLSAQHLDPIEVAPPNEVAEVARAINQLVDRVQASFDRERRFMADVAHELRTPISEVRTLAEVALRGLPADDEAREDYVEVLAAADRMASLVSTFLTLARCEAGTVLPGDDRVRLDELAAGVWASLRDRLPQRRLTASAPVLAPVTVRSREDLMKRLLGNLFDNAVSHATRGGTIEVTLEADPGGFALHVVNTAADLDASDVPRLFDRFWRKDAARSGPHAGLGLSLARAIAEALGYTLDAHLREDAPLDRRLVVTLRGPIQPPSSPASLPDPDPQRP